MGEPTVPSACWVPRYNGRVLVALWQSFQSLLLKTGCSGPGLYLHYSSSRAWHFEMLCFREPYGLRPIHSPADPARCEAWFFLMLCLAWAPSILRCLRASALAPVCPTSSSGSTETSGRGYFAHLSPACHLGIIHWWCP